MESLVTGKATLLLKGKGVSKGVVIGRAIIVDESDLEIPHYYLNAAQLDAECERLDRAIQAVYDELEQLQRELPQDAPKELAPLLNVHSLLVSDPMLAQECKVLIRDNAYNAEWALSAQGQHLAHQFEAMDDAYLRERALDIRQVIELVINELQGGGNKPMDLVSKISEGVSTIVVARDITPAEMVKLRAAHFAGFITDIGGPTSHTAIVARSMGVPAVCGATNARHLIHDHDLIVIDGESGDIVVNPSAEVLRFYQAKEERLLEDRSQLWENRLLPAMSLDEQSITILGNIENPEEAGDVLAQGGQGIGLYRTEFLFMGNREGLPSEDEQYEAYASVLIQMQAKPVTIRTLDLGYDKNMQGEFSSAVNPALGLRAVRYCLAQPEMFLSQLKALLRAARHGHLKILIPMIANHQEIVAVKNLLQEAAHRLRAEGKDFSEDYELGVMIEIPAVAYVVDLILAEVDFVSIGTNDLIQYMLAIDRIDSDVAHLFDPLHPAVVRMIAHVIDTGLSMNKPVSICGEMAGDSLYTRLLLGLGLKEFSMSPKQIPEVKHIIRQSHIAQTRQRVTRSLKQHPRLELDAHGFIV
ncbi:phosphoenolpyruvate--protein phosphotransferase [Oligella urethralis]|uniref:phosphoenolpyruvate--protein phosphotransferase n=1 Tax=Oligella urethralis TaxID=90245 RepID=UPI00288A84D5|nr:phosphoenolpyruvate--protein phosphotransferase [Oligella urethralis]